MSNKKDLPFPLLIIAIILGCAIFKQFDFKQLKFEKPLLAIIYIVTFIACVYWIVKNRKEKNENS